MRRRDRFRKAGEQSAVSIIDRGCSDLVFGGERPQNFVGFFPVVESERGRTVGADDLRQDFDVIRKRASKCD